MTLQSHWKNSNCLLGELQTGWGQDRGAISTPYGGCWCGTDTCGQRSGHTQPCKYAFGDIFVRDEETSERDEFLV